jgi:hypothetical protein
MNLTLRNAMELKGTKLQLFLGTTEICQLFLLGSKQ